MDCDHEWELIEEEPDAFRLSACLHCNATREQTLVRGLESEAIVRYLDDGQLEVNGHRQCPHCGMGAEQRNHAYDQCDRAAPEQCPNWVALELE